MMYVALMTVKYQKRAPFLRHECRTQFHKNAVGATSMIGIHREGIRVFVQLSGEDIFRVTSALKIKVIMGEATIEVGLWWLKTSWLTDYSVQRLSTLMYAKSL